jgi:hypothetical protein
MTSRIVRSAVLAVLLVVFLAPSHGATALACGARTYVHTFTVTTKWSAKSYRPGQLAVVTVTVTRPGPEDPLGFGVPVAVPVGLPAEGVTVQTSLPDYFPPPWDYDVTGADGKVKLKIRVPRDATPGRVYTASYASIVYNGNGCPDVEEFGYRHEWPGFLVKS